MKKIIFILFLIPVISYAQGIRHAPLTIKEADSTYEHIYLTGTEEDTSEVYTMPPWLTFKGITYDTTSGGDSSNVEMFVDRCTDYVNLQDWWCEDSLEISTTLTDSTWKQWIYTATSRSNEPYYRIRLRGNGDNRKLAATKSVLRAAHTDRR